MVQKLPSLSLDSIITLTIASVPFSEDRILTLKSVSSKSSKAGIYEDLNLSNIFEEEEFLDIYKNPISVDLESFYDEIKSRYYEVTNEYYAEYEKLRKARKVHKVLDLNEKGK